LKLLCSKDYAIKKRNNLYANVYTDWRVSKGNIEDIKAAINEHKKQFGEQSEQVAYYTKLHALLMESLKKEIVLLQNIMNQSQFKWHTPSK